MVTVEEILNVIDGEMPICLCDNHTGEFLFVTHNGKKKFDANERGHVHNLFLDEYGDCKVKDIYCGRTQVEIMIII